MIRCDKEVLVSQPTTKSRQNGRLRPACDYHLKGNPHGLGGGARGFNKGHARIGTLEAKKTVVGGGKGVQGDWLSVADPRYADGQMGSHTNKMRVVDWKKSTSTVTGFGSRRFRRDERGRSTP
jgi:hypothetical protein